MHITTMDELAQALLHYKEKNSADFFHPTENGRMAILRSDLPGPPGHMIFRPSVCIVVQGAKQAFFGDRRLEYRAGEALVVGVETPTVGRVVEASPGAPCLVLGFELDLAIMRSIAEQLDSLPDLAFREVSGVVVLDCSERIMDCALRLVRLLDNPQAVKVLYPVVMQEICYWLLMDKHGAAVARLALEKSPSRSLVNALNSLRSRFTENIAVEELAGIAKLSPSAFHRQFKALTCMTPKQYQKKLRLMEARRILVSHACSIASASYQVGYESASQFSREYARMFGIAPMHDQRKTV